MTTVKIVLNRNGVRDLLRSRGVLNDLDRRARRIASAAGPGHEVDTEIGPHRVRASVRTVSFEAMVDETTSHNLTRAFDAGRG